MLKPSLVDRLRDEEMSLFEMSNIVVEAADRIEALEYNNKKLHEMASRYEDALRIIKNHPNIDALGSWQVRDIARRVLEGTNAKS